MGLFSKLMFWKKEEPLPAPKDFGAGPEMGLPGEEGLGLPGHGGMPEFGRGIGEEAPSAAETFGAPRLEEAGPGPLHPEYRPPPAAAPAHAEAPSSKDLEIISLKLDSLKATLEAINERLARLEKMAEGGSELRRF